MLCPCVIPEAIPHSESKDDPIPKLESELFQNVVIMTRPQEAVRPWPYQFFSKIKKTAKKHRNTVLYNMICSGIAAVSVLVVCLINVS